MSTKGAMGASVTDVMPITLNSLLESREFHDRLVHSSAQAFDALRHLGNHPRTATHIKSSDWEACVLTKMAILESTIGAIVTGPRQLLHLAICGPIDNPPGYDKSCFFLTIVDRFLRYIAAVPLLHKSHATEAILRSVNRSSQQGSSPCQRSVRTDNGLEFAMTFC